MIGSMLIAEIKQKTIIRFKVLMILKFILMRSMLIRVLKTLFLEDGCDK